MLARPADATGPVLRVGAPAADGRCFAYVCPDDFAQVSPPELFAFGGLPAAQALELQAALLAARAHAVLWAGGGPAALHSASLRADVAEGA